LWIQTFLLLCVTSAIAAVGCVTGIFNDLHIDSMYHLIIFMNGLCTFLLSLFVSLSLTRWWNLRYSCLGELWNVVAEMTMLSCTYLSSDVEKRMIREQLLKYGLLSFSLVFKDARGEHGDIFLDRMAERQMCTQQEASALHRIAVKSETPWVWAFELIARGVEAGDIPTSVRYEFHARCLRGRTAVTNLLMYVQTPLPLMYVHLIVALVKITMVFWCLYTGVTTARAFDTTNPNTNVHDVWALLLLQICVPVVYQSALELHRKLQNPFLEHSAGFPERTFCSALRKECHDIQMALEAVKIRGEKDGVGLAVEYVGGEAPKEDERGGIRGGTIRGDMRGGGGGAARRMSNTRKDEEKKD
jgi:hypothetical protein